jgi:predicted regulator of Ras-like GTPase activity (Roadblock/LC7/MglB family)
VIRNWSADFAAKPPFPYEDIAMMIFCMADGFLIQQLVEPETDTKLYGTMNATLFKGIAASALGLDLEALGDEVSASASQTR